MYATSRYAILTKLYDKIVSRKVAIAAAILSIHSIQMDVDFVLRGIL